MSFKPITINTPASQSAHILAEDDAAIYQGLTGTDCVLEIGNKLEAMILDNNTIRLQDGVVIVNGHVGRIMPGDYEDIKIDNGSQGLKRHDLIVARFTTTGLGGDDCFELDVVKGVPDTFGVDPNTINEAIYEGGNTNEFPLWRVVLDGISITKLESLYKLNPSTASLSSNITDIQNSILDSGWNNLTLINGFTPYGEDIDIPRYRKVGNFVTIRGILRPPNNSNMGSSTTTPFAQVPAVIRPQLTSYFICQGSSTAHWLLTIYPNGNISASKYGTGSSYITPTTDNGLWFTISYLVN